MAVFTLPKELDPSWPGPGVKPTGKIEIDWDHPLAKGLALCVVGGQAKELVHGYNLKYSNGAVSGVNNGEQVLDTLATTAVVELEGSENLNFSGLVPVTFFNRFLVGSGDTSGTLIAKRDGTPANFQIYTTNGIVTARYGSTAIATHTLSSNTWYDNTISFSRSTNFLNSYLAKVDRSDPWVSLNKAIIKQETITTCPISIGARWQTYPTTAYQGDYLVSIAMMWHDRELTEAEARSLHDNPYQILKPVIDEVYLTEEADDGTTTVVTTPANSLWAAVNASINAQTEIATSPPNAVWAAINTSINATTIVSTIPPNSTWAAVNAVIETTAGGATIVTTPPNSTWLGVNASINAKTEIATTPPNSTWAGVNAGINASTIIDTSAPNAQWATFATVIEADTVISTTPPNSTWAGINANVLVVSPDADQPTGGWDYPQKPDPYEERVKQGIIQPDEPKKKVKLVQRVEQIPVDFEQIKSLEQVQAQEARLQELQRLHEEVKRRGIKKAQKEQLDREVLIKITLALNMLEQQKQLIEEQDIIFVMMMLAA